MSDHNQGGPEKKRPYQGDPFLLEGEIKDIKREQESQKARDKKYRDDQLWTNRLLAAFTGGLLITSFASILVYWDLAITGKRNADAAQESAAAANNAAGIAGITLKKTNEMFMTEEAGYIRIDPTQTGYSPSNPIHWVVNVPYTNYGKTRAFVIAFDRHFRFIKLHMSVRNGVRVGEDIAISEAYAPKTIPGTWVEPGDHNLTSIFGPPIGPDDEKSLQAHEMGVNFFGCIKYVDIFSQVHWTDFCQVHGGANEPNGTCTYRCKRD